MASGQIRWYRTPIPREQLRELTRRSDIKGFAQTVGYLLVPAGTVFRTRRLNVFFTYVFSFLGWLNPHFFRSSHTRHHAYTLHPPEDREVLVPYDFTTRD